MDWHFLYIVILACVEVYGDFYLKFYSSSGKTTDLLQGILGYVGVVYFLIKSLKGGTVLYVNGMWDGISGLVESVAAYVILGERLERTTQYLGLVMVIMGIVLLKQ
jgi:multidrug transporter EmrE-like cation transporter